MKKKVIIIVAVVIAVLAIIIGGFAYFMASDLKQEEKLSTEMTELNELLNKEEFDKNLIKERLDRIVTKGDYALVEKACKQYLSDVFNVSQKIADTLSNDSISKLLSIENYKTDGPEFNNTKKYIAETKQTLAELKDNYYELLTEEKVMSYINDKGLDSYYTDLYNKEVIGDLENERNDKTVDEAMNGIITLLDSVEKIIDFLIENKNAWQVDGKSLAFTSDSALNKYNELLEMLPIN
ncbi:MAG: hypothetical protein ACLTPN_05740 [Clostridia bacterium]|nr:hypothetical protein [Clostridium sp.]